MDERLLKLLVVQTVRSSRQTSYDGLSTKMEP